MNTSFFNPILGYIGYNSVFLHIESRSVVLLTLLTFPNHGYFALIGKELLSEAKYESLESVSISLPDPFHPIYPCILPGQILYRAERIIDGDTLLLPHGERVRLINVDTRDARQSKKGLWRN